MAEPIRVAQIVGKMVGGGLEAVVLNYYRSLDRNKYQFDFVVDSDSTQVPREEIEGLGGRVFVIPPYQRPISYQHSLIKLFREQAWPIVHCHENALSVFPLHAAKVAGVKIRIAHSHSTANDAERAKTLVKNILRTQANRYPTHRLACSNFAGEWLFGHKTDFTVLPNAIDTKLFAFDEQARKEVRNELGVDDRQFLVGHIGRFVGQKNHEMLLQIFKAVLQVEPSSVLALAGTGPLVGAVRDLTVQLGIDRHVQFLGTRADANRLYQAFDVFCLPSLYEGLPVVGVECQASSTPILASDTVTSEAAFTSLMEFESLSSTPEVWANHLLRMRGREASNKDKVGIESFDIASCSNRLEELYEGMLRWASITDTGTGPKEVQ